MTRKPYPVGFVCGAFDLFHIGHLNLLERAKEACEYLIVGVHADSLVENYKHHIPIIAEEHRLRIVASLRCVDQAIISQCRDKIALCQLLRFDAIFAGDDWKGTPHWCQSEQALKELGVDVIYYSYTPGISTSRIIEQIKQHSESSPSLAKEMKP